MQVERNSNFYRSFSKNHVLSLLERVLSFFQEFKENKNRFSDNIIERQIISRHQDEAASSQ